MSYLTMKKEEIANIRDCLHWILANTEDKEIKEKAARSLPTIPYPRHVKIIRRYEDCKEALEFKSFSLLSVEEKIEFMKEFYALWRKELDFMTDEDTIHPWGRPWQYEGKCRVMSPEQWFARVKYGILEEYNKGILYSEK